MLLKKKVQIVNVPRNQKTVVVLNVRLSIGLKRGDVAVNDSDLE